MVTDHDLPVYGGIDTRADTHHVAVCDRTGRRLGNLQVPATSAGYRAPVQFLRRWPSLGVVGIECTGSYGAGQLRRNTDRFSTQRLGQIALAVALILTIKLVKCAKR